jgi:5-methyltetrahydrofolate--homocysteine methyltransferase
MAIANPSQDLLVNTALAADMLRGIEDAATHYIERVTQRPTVISTGTAAKTDSQKSTKTKTADNANASQAGMDASKADQLIDATATASRKAIFDAVVKGNKKIMITLVDRELESGNLPETLIEQTLIPAINEVGRLYDKQVYFLPQLIAGAEAMKTAIDYLEPKIQKKQGSSKGTIVIATVSGDVHDIGKNLVSLMLKNYGFRIIDMGKDVPSEQIIQKAKEENADIIALSALMTTTMVEMKHVVELAKEAGLKAKIIIGGAVVTESYAKEIGADGYSDDAQSAVALVTKLMEK